MEFFKIQWKSSAEKELRRIDRKQIPRVVEKVEMLRKNPFPSDCYKIEGAKSVYRLRVGDYRVVYEVRVKEHLVIIYRVRHRKDAYRK